MCLVPYTHHLNTFLYCFSIGAGVFNIQIRSVIWAARPIDIPVILAGWLHAGGLMLSYAQWKDKEPVDGYIFNAPSFGYV